MSLHRFETFLGVLALIGTPGPSSEDRPVLKPLVFAVSRELRKSPVCDPLAARGERPSVVANEADLFRAAGEGASAVILMADGPADAHITLRLTRELRRRCPHCPVLLVTADSSEDFAIAAFRAGAADLIRASCSAADAQASLDRIFPPAPRIGPKPAACGGIVGQGPSIERVRSAIATAAATDLNVLITGETGTGKELVAERIHRQSRRQSSPFVCVNCAAIPAGLLESELFGFERGAFTGAHSAYEGKLSAARGGTVFLDEIGDMDLYSQAKILRAIESRRVQRLGGTRDIPLDIRIVAATNQDVERLASEGRFRQDLYYRLNVVHIHLPPLRERTEDLPALVSHMLGELNASSGRAPVGIDPALMASLPGYQWPGNIRELRNWVESAFAFCPGDRITAGTLPDGIREKLCIPGAGAPGERERVLHALNSTQWNKSDAAKLLHWSRMTLYRKISRHGIQRECNPPSAAVTA
jgi:DNA-binding NtrC family response regulator